MMNNERLPKERYLRGTTSMLGLLISVPPEFLDEMGEGMREAKKKMTENNIRGE